MSDAALDLLAALVLEDGRRWGEAAVACIRSALRSSDQWVLKSDRTESLGSGERALGTRLIRMSHRVDPRFM